MSSRGQTESAIFPLSFHFDPDFEYKNIFILLVSKWIIALKGKHMDHGHKTVALFIQF